MAHADEPTPPTDPDRPPVRGRAASVGASAGVGMAWMMLATGAGKGASIVSQIVLGWLLSDDEFGVYAAAIGLASFVTVLRDGGTRYILIQKGSGRWAGLSGPAFWMASSIALVMGLALAAAAGVAPLIPFKEGSGYADPRLPGVIAVIALSLIIAPPGMMFVARLSTQLRFGAIASLNTQTAMVRHATMILFALLGFGPLSFALPLVCQALYQNIGGYLLTRDPIWTRRVRLRMWPALLARAKWLMVQAVSRSLLLMGDYAVLGLLVRDEVLGVYFFAYQIINQIQVLLSVNLQNVLFPTLSTLKDEPARFRAAVLRATRVLSLFSCAGAIGLAVVYDPLQRLIWGDKWDASVAPVHAMALFFPFRMLFNILNSALLAHGRYRQVSLLTLLAGAGLVGVAAVAGSITDDVGVIALAVSLYFGVGITAIVALALRSVGVSPLRLLSGVVPQWVLGVACAAPVVALQRTAPGDAGPVVAAIASGAGFAALYAIGARLFFARTLRETIGIAPARLRPIARRIMVLPERAGAERDGYRTGDDA